MSSLHVRLEDHVAKRVHPALGIISETLPQKRIFISIDGRPEVMVGLVGTKANSPINIIEPGMPQELIDQIATQVRIQMPATSATNIAVAPEIPDDLPTNELDDSDDIVEDVESDDAS
jgi:hypothetical protein